MRLKLDGISPNSRASLLATLDTSSIDQFAMSNGSVSVGLNGIDVNLQDGSAIGLLHTGIDHPLSISYMELEMSTSFSIATFAEAKVGELGFQYDKGSQPLGPPKPGRVYLYSDQGLGQGPITSLPLKFTYFSPPPDGPLFRSQGFATIHRIDIYGDWWWGDD